MLILHGCNFVFVAQTVIRWVFLFVLIPSLDFFMYFFNVVLFFVIFAVTGVTTCPTVWTRTGDLPLKVIGRPIIKKTKQKQNNHCD